MSHETSTKKTAKANRPKSPKSASKKVAKPKAAAVYVAVRSIPSESPTFTEPDRVFGSKGAARKYAELLNRELRTLLNPFEERSATNLLTGGEKALSALVKSLGLTVPKKTKTHHHSYINWAAWWNAHYFDMTDAQRDTIWDALNKFDWYTVKETTLE